MCFCTLFVHVIFLSFYYYSIDVKNMTLISLCQALILGEINRGPGYIRAKSMCGVFSLGGELLGVDRRGRHL